jgi:hypothetical protein
MEPVSLADEYRGRGGPRGRGDMPMMFIKLAQRAGDSNTFDKTTDSVCITFPTVALTAPSFSRFAILAESPGWKLSVR